MNINTEVQPAEFPYIYSVAKSRSSLVALQLVTGLGEEVLVKKVEEIIGNRDFLKHGLSTKEVKTILKETDIQFKDLTITLHRKNDSHYQDHLHTKKMEKVFVETIAKPEKTYIVSNRTHTWLIHDKKSVDPTWQFAINKQMSRRRLISVIEIVSSKTGE